MTFQDLGGPAAPAGLHRGAEPSGIGSSDRQSGCTGNVRGRVPMPAPHWPVCGIHCNGARLQSEHSWLKGLGWVQILNYRVPAGASTKRCSSHRLGFPREAWNPGGPRGRCGRKCPARGSAGACSQTGILRCQALTVTGTTGWGRWTDAGVDEPALHTSPSVPLRPSSPSWKHTWGCCFLPFILLLLHTLSSEIWEMGHAAPLPPGERPINDVSTSQWGRGSERGRKA